MRSLRRRSPSARAAAPERELALSGAIVTLLTAVPVVGAAAALTGRRGALGALLATGLVTAMFALSGLAMACAKRWTAGSLAVASLTGVAIRFVAYIAVLLSLGRVDVIHRASTAVAIAVLLIVSLAYEVRYVSTRPGFFWLQTEERTEA